jgi:polyhydroxybutyrate depolymerase
VWNLPFGGRDRSVRVHLPTGYGAQGSPLPVVLNFHGYLSTASQQEDYTGVSRKADSAGFIAVYPDGVAQGWNAGTCCAQAVTLGVDDVAFTSHLLDELEAKLCVDTKRVFAAGISNGAMFAERLGCELSERVAAIFPVAGVLVAPACPLSRPISIFEFHGTLDAVVPYRGNPLMSAPSTKDNFAAWGKRNGCDAAPRIASTRGEVQCETFSGCRDSAEVTLCTVQGGGHSWPGANVLPALGHTTKDANATDEMWEFFTRHPLP